MTNIHIVIYVLPSGNKRVTYETSDLEELKEDFKFLYELSEDALNTLLNTRYYVDPVTNEQYLYHCFSWSKNHTF